MSLHWAYYNEIDPVAAKWLRNLIDAGHIAPGFVDERSIEDVKPADLRGFTQCHFFAGIGVWSLALRRAGWPDDLPIWTASCPCQPFSASGKSDGFADERHLWPTLAWLIEQCGPTVAVGEQVASKAADDWIDLVQADLEAMGYAYGAVAFPSAGVGAPHIRDRAYWVAHADNQREESPAERARLADACRGGVALELVDHANHSGPQGHAGHDGSAGRQGQGGSTATASLFDGMADSLGWYADTTGQLANPESRRRDEERAIARWQSVGDRAQGQPTGSAPGSSLVFGDVANPERRDTSVVAGERSGSRAPQGAGSPGGLEGCGSLFDPQRAGPVNGHWRDADWLFCRDGKWRPVEPGTFPLADGVAARVGRLRAYGNAINLEAAVAFLSTIDHPRSGRYVRHANQHHA